LLKELARWFRTQIARQVSVIEPIVSAIVTTYNRAPFLAAAIESLSAQTLSEQEIIVVDDGSTDQTSEILAAIEDPRLRVVRHATNRGIPGARNTGLSFARGRYIAWLDSDDVARPTRLQKQVSYLDAHPAVSMVGACAGKITGNGQRRRGVRVPPFRADDVDAFLLFRSAFQQSSVTGRAHVLKEFSYDAAFPVCEDVDVFIRLAANNRIENMPSVLIDRRLHAEQAVNQRSDQIRERQSALARSMLLRLGIEADDAEVALHVRLGNPRRAPFDRMFLLRAEEWLFRLRAANLATRVYDPRSLAMASAIVWIRACRSAMRGMERQFAIGRLLTSQLTSGLLNSHGRSWIVQAGRLTAGFL
jgi:glycosyltransferase involved in cell wall biosynthesis